MSVIKNLAIINEKIAAAATRTGRNASDITLIAVTKNACLQKTSEVIEAGVLHLGENYVAGFLDKHATLNDLAKWHFIGTLQSKKVKQIINEIDYLHSLDRLTLAEEIQKRAKNVIKCFVQVNISGELSKHGIEEKNIIEFIKKLKKYDKINIIGLMTMAPLSEDKTLVRNCFKSLKKIQEEIWTLGFTHAPCKHLSMGMSQDFEIAVEEGATMLRIGTSLLK